MSTDMSKGINPTKISRPKFYRDTRVLLSFLVSLPIGYFFGLFPAFFVHLAIGVAVDCYFFEYKKVRESDRASKGWLKKMQLSRAKLDHYASALTDARNYVFLAVCIVGIAGFFFDPSVALENTCFASYFFFRLLSMLYLSTKGVNYPFFGYRGEAAAAKAGYLYYCSLHHRTYDMADPRNPTGFFNPASPFYIHKR